MSETEFDNSQPSRTGVYCLGSRGAMAYFPIQKSEQEAIRPTMSLVLIERPDGEVYIRIDTIWPDTIIKAGLN